MIAILRDRNTSTTILGLALALAVVGQLLLDRRIAVPVGLALCLLAVVLAALPRPCPAELEETPPRPWTRREIVALALLLAFALAIRLLANGQYPIGVSYDESANGLEARDLLARPTFPIWSDNLSGRPTLHLHLVAAAFALFGTTPEALRGVSAVAGALTVCALYLLARQLGGLPVAFAAAGLLAVSRWHLSYSRLGYEAIIGPLCAALTIYFLLRGLRERRPGLFAASGLAMGTGLYTYIAYRLFPLALVPAGLVALARAAGRRDRLRATLIGLAIALVIALIATAPLLNFARSNWSRFSGRFNEVSVLTQVQERKSYDPLIQNTLRHLGMFNYRGGIRAASNLPEKDPWQPGTAMLGAPFAILFLIGLGRALRRAGTTAGTLLLATLVTSLVAGTLTRVEEGPHQTRALVAVIVAAYFAGDGLIALLAALRERVPRLAPAAPLLVGVALVGAGAVEGATYWKQVNHAEAWWDFAGASNAVGRFLRAAPPGAQIYLSASMPEFPAGSIIEFQSGINPKQLPVLKPVENVPARIADRDVLYVLTPEDYDAFKWGIAVAYPDVQWHQENDPFKRLLFASLVVPKDVAAQTLGLRLADFPDAGCGGAALAEGFESSRTPFGSAPAAAGARCRQWLGVAYVPESDRYQVGIEDAAGKASGLWLDGQEVGDGPISLAKGFVGVRVQRPAGAPAWRLRWSRSGAPPSDVPAEAIFSRPELARGLVGYYYPNPAFRAPAKVIQRDWTFFPSPLAGAPRYSIAWRGQLVAPSDGQYRFSSGGDEGTQLIVDGQLLLDTDVAKSRPNAEKTIPLTRGPHEVELRYFKSQGQGQSMLFTWQPPGRPPERLGAADLEPAPDPLRDEPRNGVPPPRS
ncbi:MAG TPA: PA14 domain-containing protein [Chloroflexota bacterium]